MMPLPPPHADEMIALPSGVKAGVVRFNIDDLGHIELLRQFIEGAAKAHGTVLQQNGFLNVLNAIAGNKAQAYFLIVAEENCGPRFAGGAVQFPTVFTQWNGNEFIHYSAVHYEDTYVSEEFRAQRGHVASQKWKGLGTYFRRARIERSITNQFGDAPFGLKAAGLIGECSSDNVPSIASLKNLGAVLAEEETPILLFEKSMTDIESIGGIHIETYGLANKSGEAKHQNIFVTRWSGENGQEIVASFTHGISTFTGEPIIRVQFTSSGTVPNAEHLRDIVSALIDAGNAESMERQWIQGNNPSPISYMRIHALNEPEIVEALRSAGATTRLLGKSPMVPLIINFTEVAGFDATPTTPLQKVSSRGFIPTAIAS